MTEFIVGAACGFVFAIAYIAGLVLMIGWLMQSRKPGKLLSFPQQSA